MLKRQQAQAGGGVQRRTKRHTAEFRRRLTERSDSLTNIVNYPKLEGDQRVDAVPSQRQVRCFLEIVKQGSLAGAAHTLSISQPAVSRALMELEDLLGAKLMERSRRGIMLTEAGEIFMRYAAASTSALDDGVKEVAQLRSAVGQTVRIGTLPSVACRVLPLAVKRFRENHSAALLRVVGGPNGRLLHELRKGELDFVVGRQPTSDEMPGLEFSPLYSEAVIAVVSHDHPLATEKDLAVLRKYLASAEVILPERATAIRPAAERLLFAAGVGAGATLIECEPPDFARSYVRLAHAVWLIARGVVEVELAERQFVALPLVQEVADGVVGITKRRDLRLSRLARNMADLLAKQSGPI